MHQDQRSKENDLSEYIYSAMVYTCTKMKIKLFPPAYGSFIIIRNTPCTMNVKHEYVISHLGPSM